MLCSLPFGVGCSGRATKRGSVDMHVFTLPWANLLQSDDDDDEEESSQSRSRSGSGSSSSSRSRSGSRSRSFASRTTARTSQAGAHSRGASRRDHKAVSVRSGKSELVDEDLYDSSDLVRCIPTLSHG